MKSSDETHPSSTMTIGTVAERFGLATHVLRHWEAMGLLVPDRDGNGHRRYGQDDLFRVAAILRAKEAGLGLEDIHAMITADGPLKRRKVLKEQRTALEQVMAAAQAQLELVQCALDCDHDDFTTCPHFRQMTADTIGVHVPRHIPVHTA
ncbi:MerR family transcriptional regulator [Streptomyces chattanoogensis]|uniref:MerR family transcriptional regulator n=2 Tax=Streptomyces chattanoogensis TaxID=66876 RepID=A0A0N0H181_9ACTN|nr:MerR family transcriptional regulator [Streptomyces chattanoogensis]